MVITELPESGVGESKRMRNGRTLGISLARGERPWAVGGRAGRRKKWGESTEVSNLAVKAQPAGRSEGRQQYLFKGSRLNGHPRRDGLLHCASSRRAGGVAPHSKGAPRGGGQGGPSEILVIKVCQHPAPLGAVESSKYVCSS